MSIDTIWQDTITRTNSRNAKALGPGGDYRLDVFKALVAFAKTFKAISSLSVNITRLIHESGGLMLWSSG